MGLNPCAQLTEDSFIKSGTQILQRYYQLFLLFEVYNEDLTKSINVLLLNSISFTYSTPVLFYSFMQIRFFTARITLILLSLWVIQRVPRKNSLPAVRINLLDFGISAQIM